MSIEENFDSILPSSRSKPCVRSRFSKITGRSSPSTNGSPAAPGTLFRALVLSEFGNGSVQDLFYKANAFPRRRIADPFMGGGTPLIEANRVGCDVQGFDINPMAAWIVREEIEHLDVTAYQRAASTLLDCLRAELDSFYRTDCPALWHQERTGEILHLG
jgi:adenine-specific DNA methylase